MSGLENGFQEHQQVGEAAFELFLDALPLTRWREEAEKDVEEQDWNPTYEQALRERILDEHERVTGAWLEVEALLNEEGYETRRFHDEYSGGDEDLWYWPDGEGSWCIVGPSGDPWFPDGDSDPVFDAFWREAMQNLSQTEYEALFPRSEYDEDEEVGS